MLALCPCVALGLLPRSLMDGTSPVADLPAQIHSILSTSAADNVTWGILIHSEKLGTLFALNANHSFVPASNTKLLMASAALLTLGTKYTYETSAYLHNDTVCFQPAGDPSFDDSMLTALVNATAAALPQKTRAVATTEVALSDTDDGPPSSWELSLIHI